MQHYYSREQIKEAFREHGPELSNQQKNAIKYSEQDFWIIVGQDGTREVRFIEDEG